MPVNKVAENVLGTIGFAIISCSLNISSLISRDHLLDNPANSSGMEVLACEVDKGFIQLACVWIWGTKKSMSANPCHRLMWAISAAFFGVYIIVQRLNIPLILQPQLFAALTITSWAQVNSVPHSCFQ